MEPTRTIATPGYPGRADCQKCGREVDTYFRNDREEFPVHPHVPGGGVSCRNSGHPVPTVEAR